MAKKRSDAEVIIASKEIHGDRYEYIGIIHIAKKGQPVLSIRHLKLRCNRCKSEVTQNMYNHFKGRVPLCGCFVNKSSKKSPMERFSAMYDKLVMLSKNRFGDKFQYIGIFEEGRYSRSNGPTFLLYCTFCKTIQMTRARVHPKLKFGCKNCAKLLTRETIV